MVDVYGPLKRFETDEPRQNRASCVGLIHQNGSQTTALYTGVSNVLSFVEIDYVFRNVRRVIGNAFKAFYLKSSAFRLLAFRSQTPDVWLVFLFLS